MPSKTNEDKIDELTKLVSGLVEQFRALDGQLSGVVAEKGELSKEVASFGKTLAVVEQQLKDLRGWKDGFGTIDQLKIDIALIRKEQDEFKKWQEEVKKQKDEWGRRFWALIGPLLGATVGWALGYFLRRSELAGCEPETKAMPMQADWERVAYHEAGHAVVVIDLWGEPKPIVFRCTNRNGVLKAEGTFQMPIKLEIPDPEVPNPTPMRSRLQLVMACAAGQVAELIRFGNASDGVAADNSQIRSIALIGVNDQEMQSEKNEGFPRTHQILQRERVTWEKIAEHCIRAIESVPLPEDEFPNRTILDAATVGRIFARYRSSLSSGEGKGEVTK